MEAAFALIGVVVGALLTAGVSFLFERRREKRIRRQASRVVAEELLTIWSELRAVSQDGQLPRLETVAWRTHQAGLAASLAHQDWHHIAFTYRQVERFADVMVDSPADREKREHAADLATGVRGAWELLVERPYSDIIGEIEADVYEADLRAARRRMESD